jgi:DNA-binding PucR family transcriptional regulator
MDAPDGALWFKADEIAFTSTYPLISLQDRLEPFITDLAERGVAGLGVKLTRYMTDLPAAALTTADALGFPIISLPEEVSWIDLINPIITSVFAGQADHLKRRESIYGGFTESLVGSAHLDDLAMLLSQMVGNPVVIDCEAEGITTWSPRHDSDQAGAILSRLRAGSEGAQKLNDEHPVYRVGGRGTPLVYLPFMEKTGIDGRIAIVEQDRSFEVKDLDCLLHAQQACSIKVMQMLNDLRAHRERESAFVSSMIEPSSNLSIRKKLLRSGTEAGYKLQGPHVVISCRFGGLAGNQLDAATKAFHVRLSARGGVLTGFPEKGLAVLILNRADRVKRGGFENMLRGLHAEMVEQFQRLRFVVGVSHRLLDSYSLPNGFSQANQARKFRGAPPDPCTIRRIDEIGLLRLFSDGSVQQEARQFVDDWLGTLMDHDRRKSSRLLATLRVFLETNGNHRSAANRLNLHHNSVRYRMTKISNLTGHDVLAPGIKLQYELALTLERIIELR